jgi:hypothetical protein
MEQKILVNVVMFDAKIVVLGVAGLFLALGVAGAFLLGFGHFTSAVGQAINSNPIASAGSSLSGLGIDIIVALIVLAIVVVVAFLYALFQ